MSVSINFFDAKKSSRATLSTLRPASASNDDVSEMAGEPNGRGLLTVYTGTNRHESMSAFGTVMRFLGQGDPVGVVLFGATDPANGECLALQRFPDLVTIWPRPKRASPLKTIKADRSRDCWHAALAMMDDPRRRMVLLSDLSPLMKQGDLSVAEVLSGLRARQPTLHVIVTGADTPAEIVAAADMVIEETCHHA